MARAEITILQIARAAAVGFLLTGLAACAATGTSGSQAAVTDAGTCKLAAAPNTLASLSKCCAESLSSNPSCREYNAERGYVIIKDNAPDKPDAYLIMPVVALSGIEDPLIFRSPVDNFWQYGWEQSVGLLRVPRRDVAMAINSMAGRTQNQLHIHISCIRPDVAAVLERARRLGGDPNHPTEFRLPPYNHVYRAVVVRNLVRQDSPFNITSQFPGAAKAMGQQSIAVIASRIPQMWYVVDTVTGPGNPGSAEELLDQTCTEAARLDASR